MSSLIFAKDLNHSKELSRKSNKKLIRKLYHGVYTNNLEDSSDDIILKEWMQVVSHSVPNGILSHRTALELRPVINQKNKKYTIFVTSTYSKKIEIGPLLIKIIKGNTSQHIEPVLPNLKRSIEARFILENLVSSRQIEGIKKTLEPKVIEEYLASILRNTSEVTLNKIRDEAKIVAHELGLNKEFFELNNIISLLLNTNKNNKTLKSNYAFSISENIFYDKKRVSLFNTFAVYLTTCKFKNRKFTFNKSAWKSLSFFESYFSNYIEGTTFIIDEAEDIVFNKREIKNRHEDSHDVLALYYLTSDFYEISRTPKTFEEFILLLKERHRILMKERRYKNPGIFKETNNKAGNTHFVDSVDVVGTLQRGFEIYRNLKDGMPKALFMMFLITEVHPFDDGNGRLARLMMNAEFVNSDQIKCIIPTVHRDNYLNGLRRGSREASFNLLCRSIDIAQAYTYSIEWIDYNQAREKIESDRADQEPDDGLADFNKALKKLDRSQIE